MKTRVLMFLAVLGLGLAGMLCAPGCGPTCPGNQPNCGTDNGSSVGIAGAAGTSSSSGTCDQLTALKSCMNDFCASAPITNPFCNCYKKGYDLSFATCKCITFSAQKFCADQAVSGAEYDCSSQVGSVGTACVPVE